MPVLLYDIMLRAHASLTDQFPAIPVYWPDQGDLIEQSGVTRMAVEVSLESQEEPSNDIPVGVLVRVYVYQPLRFAPQVAGDTDQDYAQKSDFLHALDIVHGVISWGHRRVLVDGQFGLQFQGYVEGQYPARTGQYKETVHIIEFVGDTDLATGHQPVLTGSVPTPPRVVYLSGPEGPPIQRITVRIAGEEKVIYDASN